MLFAGAFVWIVAVATSILALFLAIDGKLMTIFRASKDKGGIKYTAAGAVAGPFLGMTLSMLALADTQNAGIAQTLMSLMPIFIIPVVWLVYREKTNWRGIIGALVAVVGVAILFIA
jgi:drug/metabolite transporter (DMT)-like permease